jgi:DUF1680 family protein
MFVLSGEAKYVDIVELTLYNSILSGVSLDGRDFCYTNPLRVAANFPYPLRWSGGREPYIALSNCCPPNTVRTLAEVQSYAYSFSEEGIWVNLYGGNELRSAWGDKGFVSLKQTTDYPWDGRVQFHFSEMPDEDCSIFLRIPGWSSHARVMVNGKEEATDLAPGTYFEIRRKWRSSDRIEFLLPMETRLMAANPLVEEVKNQVAVKRGPIVYCLESPDVPGTDIFNTIISTGTHFTPREISIDRHRLTVLDGTAETTGEWGMDLYREIDPVTHSVPLRLIPYYAWGNRGESEMTVWLNVSHEKKR